MPTTLDQKRAAKALELVQAEGTSPLYRSKAQELPALIAINGLLATMFHLRDKSPALRGHISQWLYEQKVVDSGADIEQSLTSSQAISYRRATLEALAFSSWLKRWSNAYQKPDAPPPNPEVEK
jgi:CRISPR type III-B/RAMP module-associated protein Cmr5